jgi:adenosylmethionine-8-amino-7-oxononanoate aminotransferase
VTAWPALTPFGAELPPEKVAVRASGNRVLFADGVTRICATSGLWNVNLGYDYEPVVSAVAAALADGCYLPAFRYSHERLEAASRALVELVGPPFATVFWTTGGASSVEAAVKLARVCQGARGERGRRKVASLSRGFHGLTQGSMALTGDHLDRRLYATDQREILHLRLEAEGTHERVRALARTLCAIVVEPVSGTGTQPLGAQDLELIADLQREGVIVIADEVATGFGRTGPLLASHAWPFEPDLVCLSKALTNGAVPAGAVLLARTVTPPPGTMLMHAETGAGHPTAAAATAAVCEAFADAALAERLRSTAEDFEALVERAAAGAPAPITHQGRGAFQTLTLEDGSAEPHTVAAMVETVRRRGVVVHPAPSGLTLVPPLITGRRDAEVIVETSIDALVEASYGRLAA